MKKIISFLLAFVMASSTSIMVFAADNFTDNVVEKIKFEAFDKSKLEMTELSKNGKNKICMVDNQKSNFAIVVQEKCVGNLTEAVEILQSSIEKISGAKLPILSQGDADFSKKNIYIGNVNNALINKKENLEDGYCLNINDNGVFICGNNDAGTRNGVYSFIEEKLGCMFLTPDETYYPQHTSIYLEKCDEKNKPVTLWRDVYAFETVQNNWAAKLKLNGINVDGNKAENPTEDLQYEGWGSWCHNCYDYLSPDDYYDTHPEYFSEKDGKRVITYEDRDAYLCLSNPEVYEIVEKALAEKIAQNPDKLYWDFSGNDNYAIAGCECKKCMELDEKAGGTGMGTLLPFLNKLAKAFPDKYISTLAYLHTLKAPTGIKAEPNVVIKLCAMPGDQASSYLNGKTGGSQQFKEQVEQWSKITDKIVVWDYVVNFAHLLMPFPNFAVQQQNQKFYEENGIIGIFHQASRETGGEMANMRAYVLAQLMWNGSDFDIAKCVSKYVTAYYGAAAPMVIEYLNLCADELTRSNKPLGLYDGLMPHYDGYLSPENIDVYASILERAKELAENDKIILNRLEEIELPITYANLLLPKMEKYHREELLSKLNRLCKNRDITMVCEWDSLDNFNSNSLDDIVKSELKEINKTRNTVCGVAGGIFGAGVLVVTIAFIVNKRKNKKLEKVKK